MFYSARTNAFYPTDLRGDYERAGSWPEDAVQITEVERETYWCKTPPAGYELGATGEGRPTWVNESIPPITSRRVAAQQAIDAAAGRARSRFVSLGHLVVEEYLQAEMAAGQWTNAGRPSDAVPADVQVWADAAGMTPAQAADNILATAQNWRSVITTVREIRLNGKAAVGSAPDEGRAGDMSQVAQPYIDQLDAVEPI